MTTWVLLRGLARESRHWGDFARRLKMRLPPDDSVVAIDLPGNGVLHAEASPTRVADMVAAGRARLATQRAAGPCAIIALSMGGMVAVEWAYLHPDEISGCVLINSSFGGLAPPWRRLQPGSYVPLLKLLWLGTKTLARERRILELTSADAPRHTALPNRWAAIYAGCPVSTKNTLRQLAAAARYRAPPGPAPVPLLVLAAALDRLVSPHCSRAAAMHWAMPLQLHPSAGHDLPLDDPDWVIERLLAWWQALDRSTVVA